MKANLTIRWIVIFIIWTGATVLTFWNMHKIGLIVTEIQKEEVFRMDDIFWSTNAGNISKILSKKDSIMVPIDSIRLGFLSVENRLTELTLKHHFGEIKIESLSEQSSSNELPVKLYFEGQFKEILPWLKELKQNIPYLSTKHLRITAAPFSKQAKFQFLLNFKYRLSNPENET